MKNVYVPASKPEYYFGLKRHRGQDRDYNI